MWQFVASKVRIHVQAGPVRRKTLSGTRWNARVWALLDLCALSGVAWVIHRSLQTCSLRATGQRAAHNLLILSSLSLQPTTTAVEALASRISQLSAQLCLHKYLQTLWLISLLYKRRSMHTVTHVTSVRPFVSMDSLSRGDVFTFASF